MKKSFIILIILFSLPSNTASSNEYMKSILRDGNYMFRNGNFDGAIGMYEICANQYNISKYQKKCKDNIAKAKKAKRIAQIKRLAEETKIIEEKKIADAKALEEYKKSPAGIKEAEEKRIAEEKRLADAKAAKEKRLAEEKRLANFKPVYFECSYRAGTKTIFISWGYDGKTVSFEGFPIKMGKNRQDETFMTILEKKSGKDNFKLTSIYSFLSTEYSVNFNERSSTATMFGSVMRGSCY